MLIFRKKWNLYMEGDSDAGQGGGGNTGGSSGDGDRAWVEALPETVQGWDEVKNSPDSDAFWKQMTDVRSAVGNSLRLPSKEAGEDTMKAFYDTLSEKVPGVIVRPDPDNAETLNAFYETLGKPKEAEGYEIPTVEVPKGVKVDMSPADAFRSLALKHNLTQDQYKGIVSDMTLANIETARQQQEAADAGLAELRQEWGSAYKPKFDAALEFARKMGAPEALVKAMKNAHIDATTLKWLNTMAEAMQGKEPNTGGDYNDTTVMTPEEAEARITEIYDNPDHPYFNPQHRDHQLSLRKMIQLRQLADPKASTDVGDLRAGMHGKLGRDAQDATS